MPFVSCLFVILFWGLDQTEISDILAAQNKSTPFYGQRFQAWPGGNNKTPPLHLAWVNAVYFVLSRATIQFSELKGRRDSSSK